MRGVLWPGCGGTWGGRLADLVQGAQWGWRLAGVPLQLRLELQLPLFLTWPLPEVPLSAP
jgi:hypothetical protein